MKVKLHWLWVVPCLLLVGCSKPDKGEGVVAEPKSAAQVSTEQKKISDDPNIPPQVKASLERQLQAQQQRPGAATK